MTPYQHVLAQMHTAQRTKTYVTKYYPDELNAIEAKPGRNWTEKLYMYLHELNEIPKCPICGNQVKLAKFNTGYYTFCSRECARKDPHRGEKFRQTCLKRYGVEAPMQSKAIREKSIRTCIQKYGVAHANKSQAVKDKISKTNRISHSTKEYRENYKKTILAKYGVEHFSKTPEYLKRVTRTNLERYGAKHAMQTDKIKQKLAATNITKYGVSNASKLVSRKNFPELIESSQHQWLCRCPHPECDKCQDKIYITNCGVHEVRTKIGAELCTKLHPINDHRSTMEYEICKMLDGMNIKYEINNRTIVAPQEIDIYVPSHKLGIEVNGCYWHSDAEKDNQYHFNKWLKAKQRGIKIIFLWEDWIRNHPTSIQKLIFYHINGGSHPRLDWQTESIDCGLYDINTIEESSIVPHSEIHSEHICWTVGKIKK